jgi:hypothetical protein
MTSIAIDIIDPTVRLKMSKSPNTQLRSGQWRMESYNQPLDFSGTIRLEYRMEVFMQQYEIHIPAQRHKGKQGESKQHKWEQQQHDMWVGAD